MFSFSPKNQASYSLPLPQKLPHCMATLALLLTTTIIPRPLWAQVLQTNHPKRPNIILIMADDLGYGDLACYGNEEIATPRLDRLAANGIRFTDFHSSGAVCSPTRAGLMTGRYQQRAGIPSVIVADPKRPTHPHGIQDSELTFAELLSEAGYETAIFGKWHLGYYKKYNPVHHGFGQFRGYISGNVDFFSHIDQAGRLDWWQNSEIKDEPGYTTHLITKYSTEFIESNREKPFCLYVAYEPPHYPYQGPNDQPVRTIGKGIGAAERKLSKQQVRRAYKEMVEEMDRGIGEIVDTLEKQGLAENTLVMFFSDNGANRNGNNGKCRGYKGQLWEGGHRVPGIAWQTSRISPGQVCDELVTTLDVMPTLLAAARVKPSEELQLDGVNLLPLLWEGRPLAKRTVFWGAGGTRAMRDGTWKLVSEDRGNQANLFNLAQDFGEQQNLAQEHPERVDQMLKAIDRWEQDVQASQTPQPTSPPDDL